MKIDKQSVLLIIIIVLCCYNLFQINGVKTDVKKYDDKIKHIQTEIDSTFRRNEKLNEQISSIDSGINNINTDIDKTTKNITIIKNQTNEKIDSVNRFTFSDLTKFFSDRYETNNTPRYDSTTKGTGSKINY